MAVWIAVELSGPPLLLRSRFEWLREPDPAAVASPPVLIAFDLLYVKGRDISQRPLRERRARLQDVVAGTDFVSQQREACGLEPPVVAAPRRGQGSAAPSTFYVTGMAHLDSRAARRGSRRLGERCSGRRSWMLGVRCG